MSLALAFKVAAVDGALSSKAIAWWTDGPFCHVELWLSGPLANALCFSSTIETGTRIAAINLDSPHGLYVPVTVPAGQIEQACVMAWCGKHIGEQYDKLGILGFVLPFGEHGRHEMFCSESCGRALEWGTEIGKQWKRAGDHPWRISPNELYRLVMRAGMAPAKGAA